MSKSLPPRVGVGANQPSPYEKSHRSLFFWAGIFSFVLLGLQIYAELSNDEKTAFAQTFTYTANDPEKVKVTPKFQLENDIANAQVILNSDEVNNSWMDLDMNLVNDATGEKFVFNDGVEYWYGSDSDGPWTEGDRTKDVVLPGVPGGSYYLTYQPTFPAGVTVRNFNLTVNRGVVLWSNFWFVLLLLWLWPLVAWYLNHRFEVNRWLESQH